MPIELGDVFHNPRARQGDGSPATREPLAFHRRVAGYAPAPLVEADPIAERLGLGNVLIKDESDCFGLPSFKILGTSWACYRATLELLGGDPGRWSTLEQLAGEFSRLRPFAFAAATDGNHGRAVARMARWFGFDARIFVPVGTAPPRIAAIESEGAEVFVMDGSYDEAVARAADEESDRCLVISDTSWPGYEQIPRWVIDGYSTIFWEIEDALMAAGHPGPDAVVIPIGVGALASSAVLWARSSRLGVPILVGVEPAEVPCMARSVEAGHPVTVEGPHRTVMSGLRCGTPSLVAYPIVASGFEWFITVGDERAAAAMRMLADAGIVSGETGAAALAGLVEALSDPRAESLREQLGPLDRATVVVLSTEGATDPDNYERLVGRTPDAVRAAHRKLRGP
jgi:diaminopropionate ammonia-lyase